jgi:Ser/Thr protein kinase RdoA (MazF antagonist)
MPAWARRSRICGCCSPATRTRWGRQFGYVLAGYESFREFDDRELHLVEALRTLRLMHHSAWLAQRWNDPAFPAAFPWFATNRYWEERILELREQIAVMAEPALVAH